MKKMVLCLLILLFGSLAYSAVYGDDVEVYVDEAGMTHFIGKQEPKEKSTRDTGMIYRDKYVGYKGKTYYRSDSSGGVDWGSLGQTDQEAEDRMQDVWDRMFNE